MPEKKTKSPSRQAGEYVREEIEHVREGKHGARSAKQVLSAAVLIGAEVNSKRATRLFAVKPRLGIFLTAGKSYRSAAMAWSRDAHRINHL